MIVHGHGSDLLRIPTIPERGHIYLFFTDDQSHIFLAPNASCRGIFGKRDRVAWMEQRSS